MLLNRHQIQRIEAIGRVIIFFRGQGILAGTAHLGQDKGPVLPCDQVVFKCPGNFDDGIFNGPAGRVSDQAMDIYNIA